MTLTADVEKDTKPTDRASIETGEVVETTAEYERYLQLHQEFAVAHGAQHRKLLRKRTCLHLVADVSLADVG